MTIKHSDHAKDFNAATRRALLAKGIAIVSITFVPGPGGDYTTGHRAYVLDDNGTQKLCSYSDVKGLVA